MSGDETPKEGPSGLHHPAAVYDKNNYVGPYSARRSGDIRDSEEKHTLTSDNRSQSDEDHHSIPSQKNYIVAPGPQI